VIFPEIIHKGIPDLKNKSLQYEERNLRGLHITTLKKFYTCISFCIFTHVYHFETFYTCISFCIFTHVYHFETSEPLILNNVRKEKTKTKTRTGMIRNKNSIRFSTECFKF